MLFSYLLLVVILRRFIIFEVRFVDFLLSIVIVQFLMSLVRLCILFKMIFLFFIFLLNEGGDVRFRVVSICVFLISEWRCIGLLFIVVKVCCLGIGVLCFCRYFFVGICCNILWVFGFRYCIWLCFWIIFFKLLLSWFVGR